MSKAFGLAQLGNVYDDGALSNRNLIINGAMQVAQRGTSATGLTSSQYNSVDRYRFGVGNAGTWTMSQDTDAPSGFAKSLKLNCTTADTDLGAIGYVQIEHKIEGQDVQHLNKGTADAKKMTLSFWCKSNKTGDFQVNAFDLDNARIDSAVITINASATWEYKTVTYDADTTGVLDGDNNGSLRLEFWLDAGTNYSSGTVPTTWQASNNPDRAAGVTLALADSTSNYFQITGVQLEVGDSATPFEHRSYGDELARCQRYYQFNIANAGYTNATTVCRLPITGPQSMRAVPSISIANGTNTVEDYGIANRNLSSLASLAGGTTLGGFVDATITASSVSKPHGLFPNAIAMDAEL